MLLPSMTVNYVTIAYVLLDRPAVELLAQRRPSVWAVAVLIYDVSIIESRTGQIAKADSVAAVSF